MKRWYELNTKEIEAVKSDYDEGMKISDIVLMHDLFAMQDVLIICVRDRRDGWNYCPYCGQKVEGSDKNDKRLYCCTAHSTYATRKRVANKRKAAKETKIYKDDEPTYHKYVDDYSGDRKVVWIPGKTAAFKRFIDEATELNSNGVSYGYAKLRQTEETARSKNITYDEEVKHIRYKLEYERREHHKEELYFDMTGADIAELENEKSYR